MSKKIIDGSQNLKLSKKVFQVSVAVIVWSIAIALIIRLLTALSWYFLTAAFFRNVALSSNITDAVSLLKYVAIFAIFVFLVNFLWAKYNYAEFKNKKRGRWINFGQENERFSEISGIPVSKLKRMQKAKHILIYKDQREGKYYDVVE